jgi:hypothetical protein
MIQQENLEVEEEEEHKQDLLWQNIRNLLQDQGAIGRKKEQKEFIQE